MYAEHVASISGHASPKPSLLCRQLASGGCEQVVRQPTTLLSLSLSPLSRRLSGERGTPNENMKTYLVVLPRTGRGLLFLQLRAQRWT